MTKEGIDELMENAMASVMEDSSYSHYSLSYYEWLDPSRHAVSSLGCFLWTIPAVVITSTSLMGNLMIIWIVMSNSRTRSATNFFLTNLALADVLKAALDMPVLYIFIITENWSFSQVTCKLARFVGNLTAAASILSLVAVTVDRYRAIVYPFLPRLGKRMVSFGIYLIWFLSAIWASPNLIFATLVEYHTPNGTNTQCRLQWPDEENAVYGIYDFGETTVSYISRYNLSTFVLIFIVPLVIMAVCYYIIATRLWVNTSPGEEVPNRTRQTKAKRKVVKMLVIVIVLFGICWLPINVYQILAFLADSVYKQSYSIHVYLSVWWLAMSSSMWNPFIYYWLNDRFRYGFHRIFRVIFPCIRLSQAGLKTIPQQLIPAPCSKRIRHGSNETLASQRSQSNFLLPVVSSSGNDSTADGNREQNV